MKLKNKFKKPIKNIIFDFGNVILDIDIALTIKAFDKFGIDELNSEDIHPYQRDFFLDIELGVISDDEFLEKLRVKYPSAINISDEEIWKAWNVLLLDFDPRRIELLKKVAENYNIYILSNTNHPHRVCFMEKFRAQFGFELESLFTQCYYSDVMKLRKPDTKIYTQLIEDAGIQPQESLFIDDNLCNFTGAEEAGLSWYHLTGGETILDMFE